MHGLIFVTWEHYLADRFGTSLVQDYRTAIGQTPSTAPLASRIYDDETLLAGVAAACQLTERPADALLREYGRYFILNGLTSHRCAYLLQQVHDARSLLLVMRDAHAQMRRTLDGLTPPLFGYEEPGPRELVLLYDSPRQLCPVLFGAIEGAGERYHERVQVIEQSCMKRGDATCRLYARFSSSSTSIIESTEERQRRATRQQLAQQVLQLLPLRGGLTLAQVQQSLPQRPSLLLEALQHLQHAGLVSTSANEPGDNLTSRRYWRAPTID